ncbi:MAG TPA: hypothetical protein VMX76_03010 [Nevskiaceae bacterium]|nr:hypothetical protein [Nevskiaceae bacterium]
MKKTKPVDWLFFGALFLLFLLPPYDPDLGWQLRCGEIIWQRQGFCSLNQFSVLLANYAWPNYYWLYQTIIFPLFRLAGLWGLTLFNALLMSLAFFFFYQAIPNYRWEKMLAVGLVIFFSWGVFSLGIRSQLLGFFFLSLLLWLLPEIEKKPKLAAFLPLITLVWANSHGSVIIGLILLLFWGIKETIKQPKRFLFWLIILFSTTAFTLLNPFGFKIYQVAWHHFAGVKLSGLIAEWVPPNKAIWWLILLSGLAFSFYSLFNSLPVLAFAFLALKARRNVPLYFLLFFYLLFFLPQTKKWLGTWLQKKDLRKGLAALTATLILSFSLVFQLPLAFNTNASWQNYCQKSRLGYPCQAVEFLRNQPEKGVIFNRYEWGGFLIWQLPEYQIFVDGRMPAWPTLSGKSPYTIYLETLQTRTGWQETLEKYGIDWILISPGTYMDLLLQPEPKNFGWQETFRDNVSAVYKKL